MQSGTQSGTVTCNPPSQATKPFANCNRSTASTAVPDAQPNLPPRSHGNWNGVLVCNRRESVVQQKGISRPGYGNGRLERLNWNQPSDETSNPCSKLSSWARMRPDLWANRAQRRHSSRSERQKNSVPARLAWLPWWARRFLRQIVAD